MLLRRVVAAAVLNGRTRSCEGDGAASAREREMVKPLGCLHALTVRGQQSTWLGGRVVYLNGGRVLIKGLKKAEHCRVVAVVEPKGIEGIDDAPRFT